MAENFDLIVAANSFVPKEDKTLEFGDGKLLNIGTLPEKQRVELMEKIRVAHSMQEIRDILQVYDLDGRVEEAGIRKENIQGADITNASDERENKPGEQRDATGERRTARALNGIGDEGRSR